jgi:predicted dehydrogenase
VPSLPGAWHEFSAGLARALRGEAPLPVHPWDSVAGLEVLDAARVSAATGRVVELGATSR